MHVAWSGTEIAVYHLMQIEENKSEEMFLDSWYALSETENSLDSEMNVYEDVL